MSPHDIAPELLPWSPEAEQGILGGLLLDNSAFDKVGDILLDRHFYDERNRRIYLATTSIIVGGKPADLVTVWEHMQQAGQDDGIDLAHLNAIAQYVPSANNIRRYAEIVAERALMRGLLEAADKAKSIAVEPGLPVLQRLDRVQDLFQALQINRSRKAPAHIDAALVRMVDRLNALSDGTLEPGIATGFQTLDWALGGGLKPGKKIIIAARPSVGKSSLALEILLRLAARDIPCAMLSQEMPEDEVVERAVANVGELDLNKITTGKLDTADWNVLTRTIDQLRAMPLYIDDQPGLTLHDIQAKARMLVRQHGVKVMVVDYLQLCEGAQESAGDNRNTQIEQISRGTKTLAKQLGLTIIELSQLGREVEKRATRKAVLSDLKDSGSIEQDADVVILLNPDYSSGNGHQVIEADIAKNRQGPKESLWLAFHGALQRWAETVKPSGHQSNHTSTPSKSAAKHYTSDV